MLEETVDAPTPVVVGPVPVPPAAEPASAPDGPGLVETDLLVEDVSIDGMCGVY